MNRPPRRTRRTSSRTEQTRAESALRAAEEKYRSIFENAIEGMFQTTPEGRIIAANPSLARICGYDTPEQLIAEVADVASAFWVAPESRESFRTRVRESLLSSSPTT